MTPGCLTLFVGIVVCYVLFFVVWTVIDAIRGRRRDPLVWRLIAWLMQKVYFVVLLIGYLLSPSFRRYLRSQRNPWQDAQKRCGDGE